jgi:hypothetical protein
MEWSPCYCLSRASLTPSGLLQLDTKDNEVELVRRSKIELRSNNVEPMKRPKLLKSKNCIWNSKTEDLTLTVTTHRLVLFDSNDQAFFLHLSNLVQTEPAGEFKIDCIFHIASSTVPISHKTPICYIYIGGPTVRHWNSSYKLILSTYQFGDLMLVFRSDVPEKDRDETNKKIQSAMQRRAWEVASKLQQKQRTNESIAKRRVGVDHILTKVCENAF